MTVSRRDLMIGAALIALGIVVTVLSVVFAQRDAAQTRCFEETLATRSSISREDFDAAEQAIQALAVAETREERQAAADAYSERRAELNEQRAATPYPADVEGDPCA